jgi:hypothetical protein
MELTVSDRPASFAEVFNAELDQIDERRKQHDLADHEPSFPANAELSEASLPEIYRKAKDKRLVGLAFSGGGIRSATFNLGVLQGLAALKLLKFIDYISTVSGGSYIGSWFTAWIQRATGGLGHVEPLLRSQAADREKSLRAARTSAVQTSAADGKTNAQSVSAAAEEVPPPIQHLRRYSNYLAPRLGLLSSDFLGLWSSYLRNFLLCQLVLLPAVIVVLLLSRFALLFCYPEFIRDVLGDTDRCATWTTWIVGALLMFASVAGLWASGLVRPEGKHSPGPSPLARKGMYRLIVAPLVLAAVLSSLIPAWRRAAWEVQSLAEQQTRTAAVTEEFLGFVLVPGVLLALAYAVTILLRGRLYPRGTRSPVARVIVAFVSGCVGGFLLCLVYWSLRSLYLAAPDELTEYAQARGAARVVTYCPPLVLAVFVLVFFLGVGLLKNVLREETREWWSSLAACLLRFALLWLLVMLISLYATPAVIWADPVVQVALGSGWLLTVATGVLAAGSARTDAQRPRRTLAEWFARLAPPVFLVGILLSVSLLIPLVLDSQPNWNVAAEIVWVKQSEPAHPSTKLTTTQTSSEPAGPEVPAKDSKVPAKISKAVVERVETVEERSIRAQTYWLGMLNTNRHMVPYPFFQLTDKDLVSLWKRGEELYIPNSVLQKLKVLQTNLQKQKKDREGVSLEEFRELMKSNLKDLQSSPSLYASEYEEQILLHARDAKLIEFEPGKLSLKWGLCLAVWLGLFVVAAWRIDVNVFSLHAVYANRLIRCYLGASRVPRRAPDPVTGFDPNDDMDLANLRLHSEPPREPHYNGPYYLINTALNLVKADDLAWQERKAESFVFTPLYCGSSSTGYRPTDQYNGGIKLGHAVAISGAAASPNMGYHSSPIVTALLTVFNARLGAWLGNPSRRHHWRRATPRFGFNPLFQEISGETNARNANIYLSDGGHFENLGVYELVRRRCRYIIVSDAGCDPEYTFEDLGNCIRKCRIDLGIRIQVDLGVLRREADKPCRWHCAVGQIRYDDVDASASPGALVYLKASLTGDEPTDVLDYARRHTDFPHESTLNQFFSESQFESYRALGEHIALEVFQASAGEAKASRTLPGERHRFCRELFAAVSRQWFAMPAQYEANFLETTRAFAQLNEAMANNPHLRRLTLAVYPELASSAALTPDPNGAMDARADHEAAELHTIEQVLQLMENAWLSLNLDVHYAHPLNRGWMDIFYRWTSSPAFRKHWPVLRSEYGRGFVSFCERQMRIGKVEVRIELDTSGNIPELLCREFADQWPGTLGLQERLEEARKGLEQPYVWLIFPYLCDPALASTPHLPPPGKQITPCGLVLVYADTASPASTGQPVFEFLAWLRGAYRNTGLGRAAVDQVLATLRRQWPRSFILRARLPVRDLTGPGGKIQRAMWLTFFQNHDFRRVDADHHDSPEEIILERSFAVLEHAHAN